MRVVIKKILYRVIANPLVNGLMRLFLKPFGRLLPKEVLKRIPVTGEVRIALPCGENILFVTDGSDQIASRLYWSGVSDYEPGTIDLFLKLLPHQKMIIDVGANTGLFTLTAAACNRAAEVYAFEPLPRVFDFLRRNIERNGFSNVTSVSAVVADTDGEVPFFEPETMTLPSSASLLQSFIIAQSREIRARSLTLDSYVREIGIGKVDLIKIDTEGTEDRVLCGARQLLERDRPLIICEVFGAAAGERLEETCSAARYKAFRITKTGLVREERLTGGVTEEEWNYLLVPEERAAEFGQ